MSTANPRSRGEALADRLRGACARAAHAPLPGARSLPALTGLTPKLVFVDPLENVLARAVRVLVESGRVFIYGDAVVYELGVGADGSLVPLTRGRSLEPWTPTLMANLFVCEHAAGDGTPVQFPPPRGLAAVLLNSAPALEALPRVRTYATRPVFDDRFDFYGPGWHPGAGILVHGADVEPVLNPVADPGRPVWERLPPRLRALLGDFCFKGAADVVNAVAAMLTGLLMPCFVGPGKPVNLLDGNQAGVGKTWLARVIGIVLDGIDPQLTHYTLDDEELAKRVCATLRGSTQSVLLIDNAKVRAGGSISSPVIEANSMAAQISLRILGQSANYTRPNDLSWFLTMNDTKASPDLVSRGLPIRFWFDGDPRDRAFGGRDPIAYAGEHRTELLGELAGMVVRWTQAGRPPGPRPHRCASWAADVGGILGAAGLPEFLGNLDEASAAFNTALDELAALAEGVIAANNTALFTMIDNPDGDDS